MRMRPDYLVIGDAVGQSTLDALFAMGTHVNGGILSIDADSPEAALNRLARHASLSEGTDSAGLDGLIRDRIDILVHVLTYADGTDRITQITSVDEELQDTFNGFDEFTGCGQSPEWYADAIRLGHPLEDDLFN
jgi:pilus assembly protein CpaF